ncbi:MAG: glycosyltransferase family 4 protein [Anaerolineales bacterium]|nr:glycosyltransferase family 4 protein [Anaerolineales bacterium]
MKRPTTRVAILYDKPLNLGGVETHLRSIFRCADPACYSFLLIAPDAPAFSTQIDTGEIKFIKFDGWWPLQWKNYRALANIFAKEDVDIVHPHSSAAAILGRIVARSKRLPLVVTVHLPVTQYHGTLKTLRARIGRFIFIELDRLLNSCATDQIVYVSQNDRSRCVQARLAPAAKTVVIPNGIDLTPYRTTKDKATLRQGFGAPLDAHIITFVGRLDHQKGIDQLLTAFAGLPGTVAPSILWVIGEGPLRAELEAAAKDRNPEARVVFWGYQSPVTDHLFASDLFVLPSLYEAMPITLLEALAAGLPCIATDVGDNRLIIEPEVNGLIVPPEDPSALQQALQRLLNNPMLREQMKAHNLEKINNFDERSMLESIQVIYDRLVAKKLRVAS